MKLFAALVAIGIAAPGAAAAAQVTGPQTFNIVIVASTSSDVRTVDASVIVARGVFNGVGHIVEIDNLPGDPDNVLRDDLVFSVGTMHVRSEVLDFSFTVNPHSCVATFKVTQRGAVEGGTGRFATATGSFNSTLNAIGLLPRHSDGSCNQDAGPTHEVDAIAVNGTLSF